MKTRNTVRALAKGIKVGALGTLLATSTLGCGMEATNDQNQEQTQGSQYELNSYKFKRYDFLPDNPVEHWNRLHISDIPDQENIFKIMDNLETFIKTEVRNVNDELRNDIDYNYPQNDLQAALINNFPSRGNLAQINEHVCDLYEDSAKYFAQIINAIGDSNEQAKLRACYDMLADRAYRDSLHLEDFNDPTVPADQNLPEIQAALNAVGIDANNYQQIEDELDNILGQVALQNGLRPATLQACINYSLLNESLYGVDDYIYKLENGRLIPAKPERVNNRYGFAYRLGNELNVRIDKELEILQTNNLMHDNELVR